MVIIRIACEEIKKGTGIFSLSKKKDSTLYICKDADDFDQKAMQSE